MKIKRNCHSILFECPFLKRPMFHAGFTGKEGPETWWQCEREQDYLRYIKSCPLAGDPDKQKEKHKTYMEMAVMSPPKKGRLKWKE